MHQRGGRAEHRPVVAGEHVTALAEGHPELVVLLDEVDAHRTALRDGLPTRVEVDPPVDLQLHERRPGHLDAAAGLHLRQGRPAGQVLHGGRAAARDVDLGQPAQRVVARPGRGRDALVVRRVGLLLPGATPAHHPALDLGPHEEVAEPGTRGLDADGRQGRRQLVAGGVAVGQHAVEDRTHALHQGLVDPELSVVVLVGLVHPRRRGGEEPREGVGSDEVPGGSQRVGAQDAPGVEVVVHRSVRLHLRAPLRQRPRGREVVLSLGRSEVPEDLVGPSHGRPADQLCPQPPSRERGDIGGAVVHGETLPTDADSDLSCGLRQGSSQVQGGEQTRIREAP